MVKDERIKDTKIKSNRVCDVCTTSKQVRKSFKKSEKYAETRESWRSDVVVCSDVLRPITPSSKSGFKYIVSFIKMKSRFVTVYPLRKKSEVASAFNRFYQEIKTASGKRSRCCGATTAASTGTRKCKTFARQSSSSKNSRFHTTLSRTEWRSV